MLITESIILRVSYFCMSLLYVRSQLTISHTQRTFLEGLVACITMGSGILYACIHNIFYRDSGGWQECESSQRKSRKRTNNKK